MAKRLLSCRRIGFFQAIALALAGCGDNSGPLAGPDQAGYQSRAMPGASQQTVLRAVRSAIAQRYQVSQDDGGVVVSQPQYLAASSGASTGRLHFISTRSDLRQVATGRVSSEGGVVRAQVRVLIQRRDTQQHQVYHSMTGNADVPSGTMVEEGAMNSPEHQEVWTTVRRDHAAEQELLADVAARLGLPAATPAVEPPASVGPADSARP